MKRIISILKKEISKIYVSTLVIMYDAIYTPSDIFYGENN